MKKVTAIERILDYLKNQEFYESLFKEIEADIQRHQELSARKKKNSRYRCPKRPG